MPKRKSSTSGPRGEAKKPLLEDKENVENMDIDEEVEEVPRPRKSGVRKDPKQMEICSGKILYIHVKNFMCHGNLKVNLNKHANIIVGHNGSGKSAIFTALIIGLGGKASAAHRSSNIKQLVKHGQASCTIEVAIANDGVDAFDTEKYGDRIIVQRKITASGTSTYKVTNSRGEFLFKDRQTLERLLMYFNIQVDNPVCVLHQDAARSFLKDCDPKKLFVFYMKATQLQIMLEKLAECLALYRQNKAQFHIFMEKIQRDSKAVDEVRQKHKALSSVSNKKELLAQLKKELVWIKYRDLKDLYDKTESEHQEVMGIVRKLNEALASESSLQAEVERNIQKLQQDQHAMRVQLSQITGQMEQTQQEISDAREAGESQKKSCEIQKQKRLRTEESIKLILVHLANDNFEEQMAQTKRKDEERMEQLEDKKTECSAILMSLERDIEDLLNQTTDMENAFGSTRNKKDYIEQQLRKVSQEHRQLDYDARDDLAAYGGYMAGLLSTIEQHYKRGEFSKMPLGPIGRYIEVPDTKWRSIVENILGGYVTAFLVNSHKDHKLLVSIMKRNIPDGRLPTITVTPFEGKAYNYSSGFCRSVPGTYALMDIIRVKDHNVMNTLINCLRIETILLTEQMNIAMSLTDGTRVPRNLSKLILSKPFQEYAANPFRMYSMREKPARFIQVNVKDIKENLQRQEKQLKEDLQRVTQQFRTLLAEKQQRESTVATKTTEKRNIKEKMLQLENEMREIRNTVYPKHMENESLRVEHESLKATLEKILDLERREKQKYKELMDQLELLVEKKEQLKKDDSECVKKLNQLSKAEDKENSRIASETINRRENEAILTEKNKVATFLQKEKEKQEKQMQTALKTAEKTGDPIRSRRSEETVTNLIKEGKANIAFLESQHGNLEEVEQQLHVLSGRLDKDKEAAKMLQLTLKHLKTSQLKRQQYVIRLKRHFSCLMVHHFGKYLELRGFNGTIKLNYEDKTFDIKVVPRDNHIENATSSTQALSGGERSFTTVSFLLALWSVVSHPFFFLDEYDVFTDAVNRQYMTDILLRESRNNVHNQYCFLTPQDMSSVTSSDMLTLHRMADPR